MDECIIGVDLGGTQIRAARFNSHLDLLARTAEPTHGAEGPDRVVRRLGNLIEHVMPGAPVRGIGISAPGPIYPSSGTVLAPVNLPGWQAVPLGQIIQDRFGLPTYVGNDANVAALAETMRGAARGCRYVIYLTVSTGIGSGIIDDGHLITGANGIGGEAGHAPLVVNGTVTDLEDEAAGLAIAAKAVQRLKAGAESQIRTLVNNNLDAVTAKVVGVAAAGGDALAAEIIHEAGFLIGLNIANLMHLFNPQIIVVGGGVSKTGDLLFEPMREAVRQYTLDRMYWDNVPIVPAALGDDVALLGAAALVITHGGTQIEDI